MSWDKSGSDDDQPRKPRTGSDQPREIGGSGGDAGRREWDIEQYMPWTRREVIDAPDYDPPGQPGPGTVGWLENKAKLWERRAAGEDVHIPGKQIPFTTADVKAWASHPRRDYLPPPGSPVWQAQQAERYGAQAGSDTPDSPVNARRPPTTDTADKATDADSGTDASADATGATKPQNDLAESNKKLLGILERQEALMERLDTRIERLETENDRLRSDNDRLKSENDKLKAQLAEARKDKPGQRDDPGSSTSNVGRRELPSNSQDGTQTEHERRRMRLPSVKAADFGKSIIVTAGAIAVSSGHLSGTMDALVIAAAGTAMAGLDWGRDKWGRREKRKNADRPES